MSSLLHPGVRIGRCVLVRPLGEGAMGAVWEAELQGPQGFRKPVALKMVRAADPGLREALLAEARLGALLHHPNVVGVHGLEPWDDGWVVVMELVRGASVGALVESGPLPPAALLDLGVQACLGLAHVHEHRGADGTNLVHRDVKPQNLLVDQDGRVLIADLGIAVGAGVEHRAGTLGYAAPEQLDGRPEPRSDLFALGVTLYVAALRQRPFGRGAEALRQLPLLEARLADPVWSRALDEVLPGLGAVLRRCLRLDPADRFATAAELRAALLDLRPRLPRGPQPSLTDLLARVRPELAPELPQVHSLADTVMTRVGNLPADGSRFVGRELDLERVRACLQAGDRWVVLTGGGGAGKTRLALEVARATQPERAGGAWFVDLAAVTTLEGLVAAVAQALSLPPTPTDPLGQVGAALRNLGPTLVVLDTLEQALDAARRAVTAWTTSAPEACFLCTSRAPLGAKGERRIPVGPLAPADAVRLFRERAPAPLPASAEEELVALVKLLEGWPLAIELAAARSGSVPLGQLRERLARDLRLWSTRDGDRPERHRSVEASIAWSYGLLSPAARSALGDLAVCEGGPTLDLAEAVVVVDDPARWVLDVLDELVDASLLVLDQETGTFRLSLPVRHFATAHTAPEARRAAEVRHGRVVAALGEAVDRDPARTRHPARELAQLGVAARRAVDRGDAPVAAACVLGACRLLDRLGRTAMVGELLEAVRAMAHSPAVRRRLALAAGRLARSQARSEDANRLLAAVITEAEAEGDRVLEAEARLVLGGTWLDRENHLSAVAELGRAAALAEALGEDELAGRAMAASGAAHHLLGRLDQALTLLIGAQARLSRLGDRPTLASARNQLAALLHQLNRQEECRRELEAGIAEARSWRDRPSEAILTGNLANLLAEAGDLAGAETCWLRALRTHQRTGNRRMEAVVLGNLGLLAVTRDQQTEARKLLTQALRLHDELGNRTNHLVVVNNLARLEQVAKRDEEALVLLDRAVQEGQQNPRYLAMTHHLRAESLWMLGREAEAEAAQAEAERLARESREHRHLAVILAARARNALRAGDRATARHRLEEAERLAPPGQPAVAVHLAAVRAALDAAG